MNKLILLALTALMMTGCEQYAARQVGGTLTIKLESGQKLIEISNNYKNCIYKRIRNKDNL